MTNLETEKKFQFTVSPTPPKDWDKLVSMAEGLAPRHFQTTRWANRITNLLSYKPNYCVLNEKGQARILLLFFVLPWFDLHGDLNWKSGISSLLKLIFRLVRTRRDIVWFGEPLLIGEPNSEIYEELACAINNEIRSNRLNLKSSRWPAAYSSAIPKLWKVRRWGTLLLSIDGRTQDDILRSIKPSARKEIKKSARKGVTVHKVTNLRELETYYSFAELWARRYGNKLIGFKDFSSMWKNLHKSPNIYETFVAYFQGAPIAGLSIWGDVKMVQELGSFQSEECYKLKLGGADAVKWAAICWAQERKVKTFDLGGVSPEPDTLKQTNIKKFKLKWSSDYLEYAMVRS